MAELRTLARPYAKAAFQRARDEKTLAQWTEVLNFAGQVAAHKTVKELLANPGLSESAKAEFILDCTQQEVTEAVRNFLLILAENGRLTLLPAIAELFNTFRADLERTVDIDVTAAYALTEEQQQKLAQALSKRLEREVSLTSSEDKSLIGGVIVRTGDLVIDDSVRGKIHRMADALGS